MKAADLAKFALSLPDVVEAPHFDRRSFRVKKKIFMTMKGDDEAMVKVKEPEARQALFDDQPDVFFAYGGFTTAFGSVGVRVKKVAAGLMKALVRESYESCLTKAPRARAASGRPSARLRRRAPARP